MAQEREPRGDVERATEGDERGGAHELSAKDEARPREGDARKSGRQADGGGEREHEPIRHDRRMAIPAAVGEK